MVGIDPDDEIMRDALRPFSNHVFYFAVFDQHRFRDDHYHCVGCWKTIAGPEHKNAEHEGYVTLHEVQYTGFPVLIQYAWVCNECFPRYRDTYSWTLSRGSVPDIPIETEDTFDSAYRDDLKRKN